MQGATSGRRAKHVTSACDHCRRRKSKCDGRQPQCRPCATAGHQCTWLNCTDRRTAAGRKKVEGARVERLEEEKMLLEAYVATLRAALEDAGLPVPEPPPSLATTLQKDTVAPAAPRPATFATPSSLASTPGMGDISTLDLSWDEHIYLDPYDHTLFPMAHEHGEWPSEPRFGPRMAIYDDGTDVDGAPAGSAAH